ncbi:hypothetical protein, partial [Streptococcus pseudopneumoniae]
RQFYLQPQSCTLSSLRLVYSLIFIEYETKFQTHSPFIILQEDIVFNYSFSLTSYSLFLYPNVEKTALGTVFH